MLLVLLAFLSWDYRTLFYDIRLIVRPQDQSIEGNVALTLALEPGTDTIPFHLTANYTIDSVLVNGARCVFFRDSDTVFVPLSTAADTCTLRVFYAGPTLDRGIHFRDSSFFSFGQFYDTKAWLPCNDTPSAKAPARLALTGPSGYFIASNGVLDSVRDSVYFWRENHPVSPYLLLVAGGPYVRLDTSFAGIPIYYYVFPDDTAKAKVSFKHIPDMMKFYSDGFGEYPFPDEKSAFVETEDPIGMETQTCIMVGSHTITGDLSREYVFAHELAHQWWGDALTPRSWGEIWLSEGLAVWSDFSFTEHMYGRDSALARWFWARDLYFLEDSIRPPYPLRDPDYFTGATVYYKGAWVIRMLRWVMGDSLFHEGLRFYYASHRDSLVDTDDFRGAMEYIMGNCLLWFFGEWCEDVGYPRIKYEWWQKGDTLTLVFNQVQDHGPVFRMPVEIMITSASDTVRDTVFMVYPSDTFKLIPGFLAEGLLVDPDSWVLMRSELSLESEETSASSAIAFQTIGNGALRLRNPLDYSVEIRIYDATGRLVRLHRAEPGTSTITLPGPGFYRLIWEGGAASAVSLR
ncbi:MAG: M1 family metallopeptidase [candidate division WOR-3 bacterium]